MLSDVLRTCLGIKGNENVLIVTDDAMLEVAAEVEKAAKELSGEIMVARMKPRTRHAEEPPAAIASAMKAADVVLIPTSKSLSHTDARKHACEAGARVASMPGITMAMLRGGGMTADYGVVKKISESIARRLTEAKSIRITSDAGTDFEASLVGRSGLADTGILTEKGAFGNLPAGEGFIAPLEGESKGRIVFDGSFAKEGLLRRPIKLVVEGGRVIGRESSEEVREYLRYKDADNVAEIGLGANPKAVLIGNVLEDEKVLGTVHVAIGDNHNFGGRTKAEVHLDGVMKSPTVLLDGEEIMRRGRLLI